MPTRPYAQRTSPEQSKPARRRLAAPAVRRPDGLERDLHRPLGAGRPERQRSGRAHSRPRSQRPGSRRSRRRPPPGRTEQAATRAGRHRKWRETVGKRGKAAARADLVCSSGSQRTHGVSRVYPPTGIPQPVRTARASTRSRRTLVSASIASSCERARCRLVREPLRPRWWSRQAPVSSRMVVDDLEQQPDLVAEREPRPRSTSAMRDVEPARTAATKSRPVFSRWEPRGRSSSPVMSRYWPPIIPSVASTSSRATSSDS